MLTLEQWVTEVMASNGLSSDQARIKTVKQRPPRGNKHDSNTTIIKIPGKDEMLGELHRK